MSANFTTWERATIEQFAREAMRKLLEHADEIERNRAAIAELVGALLLDEEVSHSGIISAANSGLLDRSQKMRRAAIAKYDTPTTTTKGQ